MKLRPWAVLLFAACLFGVLYLFFDNKPPKAEALETSRAAVGGEVIVPRLRKDGLNAITPSEQGTILQLEGDLDSLSGAAQLEVRKQLSGAWYAFRQYPLAGWEATKIAEEEGTAQAWGIAGTTYTLCLQRTEGEQARSFCQKEGTRAFESAISLAPDEPSYQLNLAVLYTEAPPADNPMKGILMLRTLNENYPENVGVLVTLARLGVRTNQFDRAKGRLEQALALEPDHPQAVCLMAEVEKALGNEQKAAEFAARCK